MNESRAGSSRQGWLRAAFVNLYAQDLVFGEDLERLGKLADCVKVLPRKKGRLDDSLPARRYRVSLEKFAEESGLAGLPNGVSLLHLWCRLRREYEALPREDRKHDALPADALVAGVGPVGADLMEPIRIDLKWKVLIEPAAQVRKRLLATADKQIEQARIDARDQGYAVGRPPKNQERDIGWLFENEYHCQSHAKIAGKAKVDVEVVTKAIHAIATRMSYTLRAKRKDDTGLDRAGRERRLPRKRPTRTRDGDTILVDGRWVDKVVPISAEEAHALQRRVMGQKNQSMPHSSGEKSQG